MFYPAQFSQAVTISSTSVSNNSAPNQTYGGTGIARSFQTANVLGSVVNNPGGATLSNHFMFNNTLRVVQPEGPNAALTQGRLAAYQLDFTVDDPTNVGYELIVETNYRGYVSARSHNGVTATASAGHLSGYIDTDTTDALDTLGDFEANLSNFGGSISTQSSLVNGLIQKSETYNAGIFSGTRNMALLFSTFGSVNNVFLQNVGDGEATARFGFDATQAANAPSLAIGTYLGPDGEAASNHGHFVNITVRSLGDDATPPGPRIAVPEPASALMMLLGGSILLSRRKRS
jgi:hypothetical protein